MAMVGAHRVTAALRQRRKESLALAD